MSYGAPDFTQKADVNIIGQTIDVNIRIIGTDITLPIDIKAQSVSELKIDIAAQSLSEIKVDIAAQSVSVLNINISSTSITIPIDIKSQSIGNIKIDIAAQSVGNLNVNIAASSITIDMNIKAQSVGISIQSEWQVQEGNLKNLFGTLLDVASGSGGYVISYTVPSGKTLYIYSVSVSSMARSTTEPSGEATFNLTAAGVGIWRVGVSAGCPHAMHSFPTPLKVAAGKTIYIYGYNASDHTVHLTATLTGYEV